MKGIMKKIIVSGAVMLLFAALMCVSAFADGENPVARIEKAEGIVEYSTLEAAFDDAVGGDTVELLDDILWTHGTSNVYWLNNKITVDGNGHTLKIDTSNSSIESYRHGMAINSEITFKNMTITRSSAANNASYGAFKVNTNAKLTIDNVTISDIVGGSWGAVGSEQTGATVVMQNHSTIQNCSDAWGNYYGSAIVMPKGGSFIMDETSSISGCKGTKLDSNYSYHSYAVAVYDSSNAGNTGSIEINGTIENDTSAYALYIGTDTTVTIGEKANIENFADYNGTYYGSVGNAILGCADKGGTITLYGDATLEGMDVTNLKCTINGNGKTLYITRRFIFRAGGDVTFENISIDLSRFVGGRYNEPAGDTTQVLFLNGAAKVTLDKGAVIQNYEAIANSTDTSCVVPVVYFDGSGTFTMKEGSKITNISSSQAAVKATGLVFYTVGAGSKINIEGGEICNISTYDGVGDDADTANKGAVIYLNGTLNMSGGKIYNVMSGTGAKHRNYGAIYIGSTGTMNMSGGEISNCKSFKGGAIYISGGKLYLTGGTITGNTSWEGGGIRHSSGTINVSETASVVGNTRGGDADNITINSDSAINIADNFTGEIGVRFNDSAKNILEQKLGTAASDVTLASVSSVVCDTDPALFAYINDSNQLVFTKKLTLTATTDTGKYTKAGGETVYGVVRTNTIATEVPEKASVKEMGTYYYKLVPEKGVSNSYTVPDLTGLEAGKGYTADLVNIYDNVNGTEVENATVYAVNFYKIKGINGYVFETPVSVEYAKKTAKNLGNDPDQLK